MRAAESVKNEYSSVVHYKFLIFSLNLWDITSDNDEMRNECIKSDRTQYEQ